MYGEVQVNKFGHVCVCVLGGGAAGTRGCTRMVKEPGMDGLVVVRKMSTSRQDKSM